MKKRIISLILAAVMVTALMGTPLTAGAETAADESADVTLEYKTTTNSMLDQTVYGRPKLDASGVLRDFGEVDSYSKINPQESALWAFSTYTNYNANMDRNYINGTVKINTYGSHPIFALKLQVTNSGLFDFFLTPYTLAYGTSADIYLVPAGSAAQASYELTQTADSVMVGNHDFSAGTDGGEVKIGRVDIQNSGDYYVIFVFDSTNPTLYSDTYHGFKIAGMSLKSVSQNAFGAVEIEADTLVMRLNGSGITLNAKAKTFSGADLSMEDASVSYASSDESVATVANDGRVTPIAVGMAKITATVTIDGVTVSDDVTVSVRTGKVSRTIYTDEMVSAARENIQRYSWAESIKNKYVNACSQYLTMSADELWEMIPSEGIPRSVQVGYRNDPNAITCRHPECGANLYSLRGSYPWVCDPIAHPWKVQCPECERYFPTNDFEGLYKMTVAANNGVYDAELAHTLNEQNVANGGKDYLHNDLYPELGADWGVDDGMGYDTGEVTSDGVKIVHTYIAYYNHFALWYKEKLEKTGGFITEAIMNLSYAYLYTGDERYGRLGAIMLDRVADVYPTYDLSQFLSNYNNSDGGTRRGKILGAIWETYLAEFFSRAYDALFPMFDDEQVIAFLSAKANKYPGDSHLRGKLNADGKVTPESLRENCETGILREVYNNVCNSQTAGNFGMHQGSLAAAAVALDSGDETNGMIDWIFRNGTKTNQQNTGGNVSERLVSQVSRDGQGNESAPGYNRLWIDAMSNLANILGPYEGYDGMDMYSNPKYAAMISSYAPLTIVRRGLPNIGDSGVFGMYSLLPDNTDVMLDSYRFLKSSNPEIAREIAQHLYFVKKGNLNGVHYGIFVRNPESVKDEISSIISTYGEYDYDKSRLLSGYGLASLRSGTLNESAGTGVLKDTQRGFWTYFGGAVSHNNQDKLSLGIEAYGIGMTSDLGYPEATGTNPNRYQWQNATVSHNTVMVNEQEQILGTEPHDPTHFDSKDGKVKVMEVDGKNVYNITDEYDRTVVMVDYDSSISYGIDFFKVRGGNDHLYSFHPSSEENPESSLTFTTQEGGTYAGASVPFGEDPYTNATNQYVPLKYPKGYTWLENIRKNENLTSGNFWVDYKIKDVGKFSRNSNQNIRMRITMLNDFTPSEVTLATGMPPRTKTNLANINHIQYMLVRRKGTDLNTLFTTVYEPYDGSRYVKNMESVPVTLVSGSPKGTDSVKAVKVELVNGRTDYIVYAQDNTAVYNVGGIFEFSGFVGVYSVNEDGDNIYSYVNDGSKIGGNEGLDASIGGTVTNFTKTLSFANSIDVEFDTSDVTPADLIDRTIHVENDGVRNAVYTIKNATMTGERTARLDVGNITFIRAYRDNSDMALGYVYDIAENRSFTIPMSYEMNHTPTPVDDGRYKYVFTFNSHNETDSTSGGRSLTNGKYTLAGTDSDVSAPWGFVNVKTAQGYSANADWMVYQGRVSVGTETRNLGTDSDAGNVLAAIGLEITVPKSGTYVPTLKYVPQSCSPITDVYLIRKTDNWHASTVGGTMSADAFYNAVISSPAENRLGSVDLYGDFASASGANMTSASLGKKYLEAGDYQLVFVMSGQNENFTPYTVSDTDKRFYTNIYSLTLNEDISLAKKAYDYNTTWDALNTNGVWACGNDQSALGIRSGTIVVNGSLLTYDEKPVYNSNGNGSEDNLISDHRMVSLERTAPWRLLALGGMTSWNLEKNTNAILLNGKGAATDNYTNRPAVAIGIKVPVKGRYMLSVNGDSAENGANPAILFEKYNASATPRDESGATFYNSFRTQPWGETYVNGKTVVGRYDFANESGWKNIGEINVGTEGEYVVILRYDPTAVNNDADTVMSMKIKGIRLTPLPDTAE